MPPLICRAWGHRDDYADGQQRLERSVTTAVSVLDLLGWSEPVDLIGQSHGGLIAIALSALHPTRVRSVSLLATGGTPAHPMYRLFRTPGLDQALFGVGQLARVPLRQL